MLDTNDKTEVTYLVLVVIISLMNSLSPLLRHKNRDTKVKTLGIPTTTITSWLVCILFLNPWLVCIDSLEKFG